MKASRPMLRGLAGGGNLVKAKKDMANELEEPRKWCTGSQGHSFWEEVKSSLIQRMDGTER